MELVEIFKALGDENRVKILNLLLLEELCVCEIIDKFPELTQPTISHHLKILKQAGLVNDRKSGKWIYYSIKKESFMAVQIYCEQFVNSNIDLPIMVKKRPGCDDC